MGTNACLCGHPLFLCICILSLSSVGIVCAMYFSPAGWWVPGDPGLGCTHLPTLYLSRRRTRAAGCSGAACWARANCCWAPSCSSEGALCRGASRTLTAALYKINVFSFFSSGLCLLRSSIGRDDVGLITMIKDAIFCVVQSLNSVAVFETSRTVALQASLSFIIFRSLLKPTSIESMMPFNHFILCQPLLILPSIFHNTRVFPTESALCIKWPSFSFNIGALNEYSGLISFEIDWFDLLAVQGTLKSLLQHHSSKAQLFGAQPL